MGLIGLGETSGVGEASRQAAHLTSRAAAPGTEGLLAGGPQASGGAWAPLGELQQSWALGLQVEGASLGLQLSL